MYCRICGDEEHGTRFRRERMMALCDACFADAPEQQEMGFGAFCDALGFEDDAIGRSFYDDYRHSTHNTFAAYGRAIRS